MERHKKTEDTQKDVFYFGASDGTCPPAGGAVVGSDCHWQSFTPDPSSPSISLNKKTRDTKKVSRVLWCE